MLLVLLSRGFLFYFSSWFAEFVLLFLAGDYYLFEIKYLFFLVCVPILDYFFTFFDRK